MQQSIILVKCEDEKTLIFTSLKKASDFLNLPYEKIIREKLPLVFKGMIIERKLINN